MSFLPPLHPVLTRTYVACALCRARAQLWDDSESCRVDAAITPAQQELWIRTLQLKRCHDKLRRTMGSEAATDGAPDLSLLWRTAESCATLMIHAPPPRLDGYITTPPWKCDAS